MALSENDRKLLQRCLANDPEAWKEFIDQHYGLFVHVIQHVAHSHSVRMGPEEIDDLCSEVFLQIVANNAAVLQQFRGRSSLQTYLTVIVRRIVVHEVNRRHRSESPNASQNGNHSVGSTGSNSAPGSRLENQEEVQRLLSELSPEEARIVQLHYLEGKTYQEISQTLGVPYNSLGPILTRARERMRGNLG